MPVIDTRRDDIRALQGVHLFHFATSNCSQRVRFALEEKGVDWVSHHVDLVKCENATSEFTAINPKGLVPVLIHDGVTHTESNDIIRYIDESFAGPVLTPQCRDDQLYLEESLVRSSAFQPALKLLTHEFLFKPFRRMNESQLDAYAAGTNNEELIQFMREFSSKQGFGHERIAEAVREADDILRSLEDRLEGKRWLSGREFGLTDISWVVNLYRLSHMHYPLSAFPRVEYWLGQLQQRPAFSSAIARFESKKMVVIFNLYSALRRVNSSSIRSYLA